LSSLARGEKFSHRRNGKTARVEEEQIDQAIESIWEPLLIRQWCLCWSNWKLIRRLAQTRESVAFEARRFDLPVYRKIDELGELWCLPGESALTEAGWVFKSLMKPKASLREPSPLPLLGEQMNAYAWRCRTDQRIDSMCMR
jgi:hypothetical protein